MFLYFLVHATKSGPGCATHVQVEGVLGSGDILAVVDFLLFNSVEVRLFLMVVGVWGSGAVLWPHKD